MKPIIVLILMNLAFIGSGASQHVGLSEKNEAPSTDLQLVLKKTANDKVSFDFISNVKYHSKLITMSLTAVNMFGQEFMRFNEPPEHLEYFVDEIQIEPQSSFYFKYTFLAIIP